MVRIVFSGLLVIHGLIHGMGFAKAFDLFDFKQLTVPISKIGGVFWLVTSLLFIISAILFLRDENFWWLFLFAAIFISQILIISTWHDSKFGSILNGIALIAAILGYAQWNYFSAYQKDVAKNFSTIISTKQDLLSESDIELLPEPVKKYIRYAGCVGKPKVQNFKINFEGKIRKNDTSPWMPFSSEQYNFMSEPTRLFFMKAIMKGMPVAGYHSYKNGIAYMDIRLLSLFKVQYQEGTEMNIAETVTFFNDMCCMAPATLIDKRINWKMIDDLNVSADFTCNVITIQALLSFNEKGELINFKSNDRYAADYGKKLPWATPLKDYKMKNGFRLAGYAETIYTYPEGDQCYGTFSLTSVEYNCE